MKQKIEKEKKRKEIDKIRILCIVNKNTSEVA